MEVLVQVFLFLIPIPEAWVVPERVMDELDEGMQDLIYATHVCKFWRDVALDTSPLWATFAVGTNYGRERACLQRSRDHPLTVYMPSTNHPFLVELSSHFHRLKELHTEITLPPPTEAVCFHLDALFNRYRAPLLESLTVRNRIHSDIKTRNPLQSTFSALFLGLKRLHTVDLAITLTDQCAITGLTHLRLDGSLIDGARMDLDELLDFLEFNPELEELYISGALFTDGVFDLDSVETVRSLVPLPNLRKLSLRQFESSKEIIHLLSYLAIPPGCCMDLGCNDTDMTSGRLLFPHDMGALGNMQRFTHLRIDFTSRYAESIAAEDDLTGSSVACEILHRSYNKMHRTNLISALSNMLPLDEVRELWISGPRSYWIIPEIPAATWRTLFALMPNLTTIHLEQTKHNNQLIAALCLDDNEPTAVRSIPAPNLKNIHFIGDCGLALGSLGLRTLAEERANICGGLRQVLIAPVQNGEKMRDLCSYLSSYVEAVTVCDTVGDTGTTLASQHQKAFRRRFISV
ncbi:hypothetical protein EIP86_005762 [Pleurotus ostreatoroseus]|nr:hypothetical protein EIP86_005762 [Pleurotus ostreatoroseus]